MSEQLKIKVWTKKGETERIEDEGNCVVARGLGLGIKEEWGQAEEGRGGGGTTPRLPPVALSQPFEDHFAIVVLIIN